MNQRDRTSNPWKVISQACVYENPWIRVDHHEVLNPAGAPGIYGTVHFKNHATAIVPIDERGKVVLVGQYRFAMSAYSWEVPEGGATPEAILQSAQRELLEECGLVAANWLEILGLDLSNSVSDERGTCFLAWNLSETAEFHPDPAERVDVKRLAFWEAVGLAERGEIRDAMSAASLFRVALMAVRGQLPPAVARLLPIR